MSNSKQIKLDPIVIAYFKQESQSKEIRELIESTLLTFYAELYDSGCEVDVHTIINRGAYRIIGWGQDYIEVRPADFFELLGRESFTYAERVLGPIYQLDTVVLDILNSKIKALLLNTLY